MPTIEIRLPRDRRNPGQLVLKDAGGEVLIDGVACLGKADAGLATGHGNPTCDPMHVNGDTPSGGYGPARLIAVAAAHQERLGPWFLPLDGVSGDALTARNNGRQGLGIHSGREGRGHLVVTEGCVRIANADMTRIAAAAGNDPIAVTIVDID